MITAIKRPPLAIGNRYRITHRDNPKATYMVTLTFFDDEKLSFRIDGQDNNTNYKWENFDTEWYLWG